MSKLPPVIDVEASLLESVGIVFDWQAEILQEQGRANFSASSKDKTAVLSFTGESTEPKEIAIAVVFDSEDVASRQHAGGVLVGFVSAVTGLSTEKTDAWLGSRLQMKTGNYTKNGYQVKITPLREQGILTLGIQSLGFE